MIKLNLSRTAAQEPASDFDMGDIELIIDSFIFNSSASPRYQCMIYISLIELIDKLTDMKAKRLEFVAVDSSFSIKFKYIKSTVELFHNHQITPPIDRVELLKAVDEGLNEFLSTEKNCLPTNSRIAADLCNARNNLKTTLQKFENNPP